MPHFLKDGSLISNSVVLGKKKTPYQRKREKFSKVKARVDEILFIDDPRNSTYNTTAPQVEYICTIIGGPDIGRRLFNVKAAVPLGAGSPFNTAETILTPTLDGDTNVEGNHARSPEKTSGSIVMIEWLHGHEDAAVITGCLKHPKAQSRATKADGNRFIYEFSGVKVVINKDGELTITYGGGPKNVDGEAGDTDGNGAFISISRGGDITLGDDGGQQISINKANRKISLESSQNIEMEAGQNWTIEVQGTAKVNATGPLNLWGGTVSLGTASGMPAARMNDTVLGFDGEGRPINAWIGIGSSTVLIGG